MNLVFLNINKTKNNGFIFLNKTKPKTSFLRFKTKPNSIKKSFGYEYTERVNFEFRILWPKPL